MDDRVIIPHQLHNKFFIYLPYDIIVLDKDGTSSIDWGAYGVPESFLIYQNNIIKRFIGPINNDDLLGIQKIIK